MRTTSQKTCAMVLGVVLTFWILISVDAYAAVPDVVLKQKRAVVTIYINDKDEDESSTGSGFILASHGIIATNYHVISKLVEQTDCTGVIKMENGAYFPVKKIVSFDEDNDIALIQVDGKELAEVRIARDYLPKLGESIIVIGSPFGLETTVSDGIISSIRGEEDLLQITAPISPGSSGSPVFNQEGEAIGIATFLIQGGQNLNFAIPIKHVVKLLSAPKKQRSHVDLLKSVEKPAKAPPAIPDSDVRVQDNGWLRIVDEVLLKQTSEEFNKQFLDAAIGSDNEKSIETWRKIIRRETDKGKIYRTLGAKIEFLKPCKATMVFEPNEFPWFCHRCNYRLKAFVTFYSVNGVEIATRNTIPCATVDNNAWKYMEVLPGERMWITFPEIPDNAEYWKVWLPK